MLPDASCCVTRKPECYLHCSETKATGTYQMCYLKEGAGDWTLQEGFTSNAVPLEDKVDHALLVGQHELHRLLVATLAGLGVVGRRQSREGFGVGWKHIITHTLSEDFALYG